MDGDSTQQYSCVVVWGLLGVVVVCWWCRFELAFFVRGIIHLDVSSSHGVCRCMFLFMFACLLVQISYPPQIVKDLFYQTFTLGKVYLRFTPGKWQTKQFTSGIRGVYLR